MAVLALGAVLCGSVLCGTAAIALAQPAIDGYADYDALTARLKKLPEPHARLESLGQTLGGRDLWLVTIASGKGKPGDKPGLLIVGNAHAPHLIGSELAMRLAERLAGDDPAAEALREKFTIYIVPRPNPDASEAFFRRPYWERAGNERPTDDDRDGELNEDPPNDLDGNQQITQMRIEDPSGPLMPHPGDPRVLIEADPKKNEQGQYRLLSEGRDDDQDDAFDEDPAGGVSFNRNFTHRYPFFQSGAGPHQVSEVESRAVADFAFAHPNIAVVFTFTPEDNLFEPWKPGDDGARIKQSVLSGDAGYLSYVAEQYRTIHGGKDAPSPARGEGSFNEWAYFNYGRWSLAARAWWIPKVPPKAAGDKAEGEDGDKPAAKTAVKPSDEKRGADDLNTLAWFEREKIDGFVAWQPIEHPDFPGRKVEVGGFKPYLRINPPAGEFDALADKHLQFLSRLASLMPQVKLERTKLEPLGEGVFRLTAEVVNHGFLPSMPAMGKLSEEPHPLQIELALPDGGKLITGSRRVQVEPLAGSGGKAERVWLFTLRDEGGTAELHVWSPSVGSDRKTIELK